MPPRAAFAAEALQGLRRLSPGIAELDGTVALFVRLHSRRMRPAVFVDRQAVPGMTTSWPSARLALSAHFCLRTRCVSLKPVASVKAASRSLGAEVSSMGLASRSSSSSVEPASSRRYGLAGSPVEYVAHGGEVITPLAGQLLCLAALVKVLMARST